MIEAFLAAHGYGAAARAPLAQDASTRRYWRLTGGPRPAVLMAATPPELPPFLDVASRLAAAGLSVPDVIARDESGLLLLEDFGDALLHTLPPTAQPDAFAAAADALAPLQAARTRGLPAWDAAAMAAAALATFLDWWWPAHLGTAAPPTVRADIAAALAQTLAPLDAAPPVFVHRDYFSGNLIWLPDRAGPRRIGILDFQSAARGHPAYDHASLAQDSRRPVPPAIAARVQHAADPAAIAVCAAQRHMRVVGLWCRLATRDGKPHYLAYAPHTWRLLEAALTHPANRPLAEAFDRHIPPAARASA